MGSEPDISRGAASARVPTPSPLTERRLLIVEDSPTMRRVIRRFLDSTGYVIFEAGDGEEALRLAARERPDVILLDWELPCDAGVTACRRLRETFPGASVVMLIGWHDLRDRRAAWEAGAKAVLHKPVDFETLDDDAVTIRERDTMSQERVSLDGITRWFAEKLVGC